MPHTINRALDDLPLEAFDLHDTDIRVDTLTTGHSITESAGSCCCAFCPC